MNLEVEKLNQRQIGRVLGVTPREIYNLEQKGLPRRVENGRKIYPLDECVQWYARYRESVARRSGEAKEKREQLETRGAEVEVRLKELELEREMGNVVTLDYMEQQNAGILHHLRAKLLSLPGRYSPQIVGLRSLSEAQQRLEAIGADLMLALSETGEEEALDDEPVEAAAEVA